MIAFALREIAHALGGEVCGDQVLAPGPAVTVYAIAA